jgi:1-phosphatidylinositol-4-phosphate 5-kinase
MKMYGQVFYFVVMGNILNTSEVIHRRYDIKGSWVDRNAPACVLGEKYRCSKCNRFFTFGATGSTSFSCESTGAEHHPDIILRDNDLKKRLKLDPDTAVGLVKQLIRDTNFLASMGVMDYSLLIGAHYSSFTIGSKIKNQKASASELASVHHDSHFISTEGTAMPQNDAHKSQNELYSDENSEFLHILCEDVGAHEPSPPQKAGVIASASQTESTEHHHRYLAHQVAGPSAYYFGLIDILQKWTIAKQVERLYKVRVLQKSARGVSAIAPKPYASRFQQKMRQLFITSPVHHNRSMDLQDQSGADGE